MKKQKGNILHHLILIIINILFGIYNWGFYTTLSHSPDAFIFDERIWYFLGGIFIFIIVNLFSEKTINFFMLLEHEFTHLLGALITFNSVVAMNINLKKGGYVKIEGGNSFIAILPYVLPLASFIFVFLKYIIIAPYVKIVILLLGFFECFYLFRLLKEIHPGQTDFKVVGMFYSFVTIINLNAIIQGFILVLTFNNTDRYISIASNTVMQVKSYIYVLLNLFIG